MHPLEALFKSEGRIYRQDLQRQDSNKIRLHVSWSHETPRRNNRTCRRNPIVEGFDLESKEIPDTKDPELAAGEPMGLADKGHYFMGWKGQLGFTSEALSRSGPPPDVMV